MGVALPSSLSCLLCLFGLTGLCVYPVDTVNVGLVGSTFLVSSLQENTELKQNNTHTHTHVNI